MRPRSAGLLFDILTECDFLMEYAYGLSLDEYLADPVLHRSVERAFEIIGESAHKLNNTDQAVARRVPNSRSLVAFRNLIIHSHNRVDDERVLGTIERDVPDLRDAVRALLGPEYRSRYDRERDARVSD